MFDDVRDPEELRSFIPVGGAARVLISSTQQSALDLGPSVPMDVFCGIDWAEDHHDIALVDRDGRLLGRRRISDDAAGLAALLALFAEHRDSAEDPVPVAIETPRGLLVACLRATGRPAYPINPMAVARYRHRHSVAGRKSDHGDAVVLANILRTDLHAHRPLPADTELARAIAVLARAQQDAVCYRTRPITGSAPTCANTSPSSWPPTTARAAGSPARRPAQSPAAAPTPADAAALTVTKLRAILKKAGRSRGLDTEATRLRDAFCASQMRQLPLVTSSRPWAARPSPCSASSTPPAPPPITSSRPPPSLLTCTRTPGSSPASQGSAH